MDISEYKDIVQFLSSKRYPDYLKDTSNKAAKNRRDSFKAKTKKFFLKENSTNPRSLLKNELYRITPGHSCGAKVLLKDQVNDILAEFHEKAFGGHVGVNRTREAITRRYWWFGFTDDVNRYVKSCEECKKGGPNKTNKSKKSKMQQIKVNRPFELVGVELVGPLTETSQGNRFIFTATDYFTKWVEAFPIQSKTASEVGKCFEKIFTRHGAVNSVLTGQGREFIDEVNEHLHKTWNVQHSITSTFHPQVNSITEKTRQTLKQELCNNLREQKASWDVCLDAALFSLRTKPYSNSKYSPFFLLYGREAVHPSQLPEEFTTTSPEPTEEDLNAYVLQRQQTDTVNMNTLHSDMDNTHNIQQQQQQLDLMLRNQDKGKFELFRAEESHSMRDHIEMVTQIEGEKVWHL